MGKWADYGIFKVNYSGCLIDTVALRGDPGGRMGEPEHWSREHVVTALILGVKVVTMTEVPAGGWTKSNDLGLIEVNDELYVRIDCKPVARDDLGL